MNLRDEINKKFALISRNSALKIDSLGGEDSWIVKSNQGYGVAIVNVNNFQINEKATSIRIWNDRKIIGDQEFNLIFLTTNNRYAQSEFASICAQFVDYGKEKENRNRILENPLEWWEKWKKLLGNKISEKTVYDVLGELLVYEKILKNDINATWSADNYGIIDIVSENNKYEVKTTIGKYLNKVTISSQFQLAFSDNLYLRVCIMEPDGPNPVSINDVINRLPVSKEKLVEIEAKLENIGYEKSSSARNKKYSLIEMREYVVDDDFPRITKESFIGGKIPVGILKIIYEVSLDGLLFRIIND